VLRAKIIFVCVRMAQNKAVEKKNGLSEAFLIKEKLREKMKNNKQVDIKYTDTDGDNVRFALGSDGKLE
jgi:hypothetical protein